MNNKIVNPQEWISPAGFKEIKNKRISIEIASSLLMIENIQFNIHKINVPTKPHSHSTRQMIYYLNGAGVQVIGKQKFQILPHSVLFVPAREIHFFEPSPGVKVEVFALNFTIETKLKIKDIENDKELLEIASFLLFSKPKLIEIREPNSGEIEKIIKKIIQEVSLKDYGYLLGIKGYIFLILRLIVKEALRKKEGLTSKANVYIWKATSHINENYAHKIRIKEISEMCGVSTNYLQKLFKKFLGISFTGYIQKVRIDNAKSLLKTTDFSITEIAGRCGIYDPNYFTRIFKKIVGIPPREYRRK